MDFINQMRKDKNELIQAIALCVKIKEIVNKINASDEGVVISGNKISLAGKTIDLTSEIIEIISTNFNVDKDGNVTMNDATIYGDIYLPNSETKVIGSLGIITNLQYSTIGKFANFDILGFETPNLGSSWRNKDLSLDVYIPANFTVLEAKVSIFHTPADHWYMPAETYVEQWGYARNIKLYKSTNTENYKFVLGYYSEYTLETANLNLTEISNAFGASGYTATNTTGSTLETTTSIDIKDHLVSGNNKLILRSTAALPTTTADGLAKSGMAIALINIIGFKK